jgi:hypothetical protein
MALKIIVLKISFEIKLAALFIKLSP